MRNSFKNYATYEDEERKILGDSKPIVAKAVANRLFDEYILDHEIGWDKFSKLKEVLTALK